MLRVVEIGLFLLPFAVYVAWRLLGPHVRRELLLGAALTLAALVGLAFHYGLRDSLDPHTRYAPARIEGGVVVPGGPLR
jgi:hypothetical protein